MLNVKYAQTLSRRVEKHVANLSLVVAMVIRTFCITVFKLFCCFKKKKAVLNCIISRNKYLLSDLGVLTELSVKATECNVKPAV